MTAAGAISVIIPAYNGGRVIRDALASVCGQTQLPAEVVVVDDASTDDTVAIAGAFARSAPVPVRVLRMPANTGGPYGPTQEAFLRTTGEYVCVLDQDDTFAPDAFESYLRMFAAGPAGLGLATSDFATYDASTGATVSASYFARHGELLAAVIGDASGVGVVFPPAAAARLLAAAFVIPYKGMFARRAWAAVGGPDPAHRSVSDIDLVWRLVAAGHPVRVLGRPLVRVGRSPDSLSRRDPVMLSKEIISIYEKCSSVWPTPRTGP